jgi:hypothetical protein
MAGVFSGEEVGMSDKQWAADIIAAGGYTRPHVQNDLDALRNVVDFAYEHGYHEHGVPLVDLIEGYIDALGDALYRERTADRLLRPSGELSAQDAPAVQQDNS